VKDSSLSTLPPLPVACTPPLCPHLPPPPVTGIPPLACQVSDLPG
jgi:hypothetical protein